MESYGGQQVGFLAIKQAHKQGQQHGIEHCFQVLAHCHVAPGYRPDNHCCGDAATTHGGLL